ncbi:MULTISPECIES: cytochrome P450 [unclassified Salinibacterium]|uniref:cytochrome P450 n=1 Tax=unclassified Salinibacterium TaxID=2632331 RepID=UPI0018CE89F4|nr:MULTISPECIES: cytochrome P450 [unclassified Salinibacterium]MBH0024826.1 cytochrome P450 [Salinibacterium sp. SWN248]MBH0054829.1 cytochrome P450 [Salinibacterium sp. SWN139]MBH0084026.1 cytochrome P450 [Salinibacterium sp. SWN167]
MTTVYSTEHELTTDEDISSEDFWRKSFEQRDETFARLRKDNPVSWHRSLEVPTMPQEVHGEAGFWAVTLAEDIRFVSENNEIFSSAEPGHISLAPRYPGLLIPPTFLSMDPPFHTRYRQIMSRAFTPKAVGVLSVKIKERAAQIVDRVVGAGEFDFVHEVSAKLPMLTVADMVGVPEDLVGAFAQAGDNQVGASDPDILPAGVNPLDFVLQQIAILQEIGVDIVNHRRKYPAADIATALANADFDGKPLSDDDIGAMMLLLSVAGNDTTKQTTSRTVVSLDRNPDQRDWLMEDYEGRIAGSIEEFVRHASPVIEFARTAREDIELRGQKILKGDKVVIFYGSGNRDEREFEDPHKFDLTRGRSPHVGFGGGGVHFCLGNGVAKAQLNALFSEITTKLPNMEVGEPVNLYSNFINGVKNLPVKVS